MSTVFVLGAGASIGASPKGRTRFPATNQIVKCLREIYCEKENLRLPALAQYLTRFSPIGVNKSKGRLHAGWDTINVEELYAAIEFESRITDHLLLRSIIPESEIQFFQEYFAKPYRAAVTDLLKGHYQDWMRMCYSASYGSKAFPHLHENFLRVVKMELLDSIAHTLGILTQEEHTSNFSRLVRYFQDGDSLITFNYDLLVEQCLSQERPKDWSYLTGYGSQLTSNESKRRFVGSAPDQPSKFVVLKLHGSCNWHFRFIQGPGSGPPVIEGYRTDPEPIGAGNKVRDVRPESFQVTDNYSKKEVEENDLDGYYERFMIPPSTYKAEYNFSARFLHNLRGEALPLDSSTMWLTQLLYQLALRNLSRAKRIVFIGYSMPPTDTSIRMLFRAAADANGNLSCVEIADPDDKVVSRIKAIFPNAKSCKQYMNFGDLLDKLKL